MIPMYEEILRLAQKSDCFYLYDEARIKKQIAKLQDNFKGIDFLYSVKCNPNRNVVKTIFGRGFGADAASLGEVKLAAEAGLGKNRIYYSAPGKSRRDIREALPYATLIADSLSEIGRISEELGEDSAEIGLRINPDYGFGGAAVCASKFGVDEACALEYLRNEIPANIKITGIHVHQKSQELNAENLKAYYRYLLSLAEKVEAILGYPLCYLNMGSGIGVAYSPREAEIDIAKLGRETEGLLADFRSAHPDTRIIIETGRYLVCQAGTYATHVVDKKVSHGKTYVILQNTLNGFIRPSIVCMVAAYAKGADAPMYEPLFTSADAFSIYTPYSDREHETVTVTGNLCTSIDIIADNVSMPKLEVGDLVLINNAGAYAAVISPMQFASQPKPDEFMLLENGEIAE